MKAYGKKYWAFPGGNIPLRSTGKEPEFSSHNKIAILNISETVAHIEITIFYENSAPVSGYNIKVNSKRLRKIRFNDLIDPVAISLERNYGCYIKSDVPVVIQFSAMDTGSENNAQCATIAYSVRATQ